jgi:hypothetical protein
MSAPPDERSPWDKQPGEPPRAFHGFGHYRDFLVKRSIDRAWHDHKARCEHLAQPDSKRSPKRWRRWSVNWGWLERAAAWDREQDQIVRAKIAEDQLETRVRHARMAQAALQVLTVPSRAALEALQDPAVLQKLIQGVKDSPALLMKLIDLVSSAARTIPGLVDVERLSLGMNTDLIEIEDTREFTESNRIAADPEATDLAIRLVDRLSSLAHAEPDTGQPFPPDPPVESV